MDMSLIAGMPEVIAYIKSQDERIKKLKGEIEEWEEVASVYWVETPSQLETWMSASIHEDDEVYSKYMEPLELRDENEKLKEQNERIDKMHRNATASLSDAYCHNRELKQKIEDLEARVEMYAQHNKKLNRDMEESEKYDWKKKYHHLNTRFIALENIEKKLKAELDDVKEENERLDKQRVLDIQRMMKGDEYKKENEKLKDEIEDLESRLEDVSHHAEAWEDSFNELNEEIDGLKEENEDFDRRFNDVNHVPFNSKYTDKAINEFLDSIPIKFLSRK